MPVYPIVWHRFETGHLYQHMAKHDARIWERFIARFAENFDEAAYDIGLGGQETTDPDATPRERLMWRWNTAKKIDAVARNRDELWLCEVRPAAGLAAVGAVLGYTMLSELDKWPDRPLIMTLVTDHIDPDTRYVAEHLDIQVVELPEPDVGDPPPGG